MPVMKYHLSQREMSVPNTAEPLDQDKDKPAEQQLLPAAGRRNLLDLFIILAKHKFLILGVTAGAAVLSLIISLLLPTYYTATTRILPPQQNQSMAMAMLGQLGPLISATAGKDLGLRNPNDLYVSMLRSQTIEDALLNQFSLLSRYKEKYRVDARRHLESLTEIVDGNVGVISVAVDDRDPRQAAAIANAYIDELTKLTKTLAVTEASKQRLFFEREVHSAADDLASAEQAMKQTEEHTGIIQLDNQSKVMLQSYADLRAQVANKEVQVQSMRSFASDQNPRLIRAEQELAALRSQLSRFELGTGDNSPTDVGLKKVPGAGLEYMRKLREVKYRETLLELLTKQYEVARIDEAKDASIIQVLDPASIPERKSWPHRAIIVLLATLLFFQLSLVWAYVAESWQHAKDDPQHFARLQILKMYLHRGLHHD
jgi:uncharacterized protein involved in exopolysaccharide biosynthesis